MGAWITFYKAALSSISLAHTGNLEGEEVAGSAQPGNIAWPSSFTVGKN